MLIYLSVMIIKINNVTVSCYNVCPVCGSILDRDINASINILNRWDGGD